MEPANADELRALGASTSSSIPVKSHTASEVAELKAEIEALKYKIASAAQEEELAQLRRESEMREVRRKGEEDFRARQHAEGEKKRVERQVEEVKRQLENVRAEVDEEKRTLERKVRQAEEGRRLAEEEVEDVRSEAEERVRMLERQISETKNQSESLKRTVEELTAEADVREQTLKQAQTLIQSKDLEIGNLESEVLRLKAQTGDVDTLAIIKRELSEQVTHIRALESSNREQAKELKHLRMVNKSVEIVEEEKRNLQRRLEQMESLEQELGEARLQRQRLEDERLAWTAYLQAQNADGSENENDNGELEFETPEEIAKALVSTRMEAATLLEKLGRLEPAISERDGIIANLEAEKLKLAQALEDAKSQSNADDAQEKVRLERQRALAVKEVEMLRAQIKARDEEEKMESEAFDAERANRIEELEGMVNEYSAEVQKLQTELEAAHAASESAKQTSLKRAREEDSETAERLGELTRKNRKLQDELGTAQKSAELLNKELRVAHKQLKAAKEHKSVRVLEIRDNPTARVEKIKMSTLESLKAENAALLAQLRGESVKSVPIQTLEGKERDILELQNLVASTRKSMDRLKTVWGAKTAEFREGISSLLGWKVEFLPNGKMKVTSLFYESTEEEERSIVFDGEKGTMKVSGGPRSAFAEKIGENIGFWVRERGEIPCLLAALTLEFYEERQVAKEA